MEDYISINRNERSFPTFEILIHTILTFCEPSFMYYNQLQRCPYIFLMFIYFHCWSTYPMNVIIFLVRNAHNSQTGTMDPFTSLRTKAIRSRAGQTIPPVLFYHLLLHGTLGKTWSSVLCADHFFFVNI